jgi:hypothetical protein
MLNLPSPPQSGVQPQPEHPPNHVNRQVKLLGLKGHQCLDSVLVYDPRKNFKIHPIV